jgi:hypothetical protein
MKVLPKNHCIMVISTDIWASWNWLTSGQGRVECNYGTAKMYDRRKLSPDPPPLYRTGKTLFGARCTLVI